jgi:hypothetical protein
VMSGDHAKRDIVTGDKPIGSGRTLSKESDDKYKEESYSSIKSHRKGDMKKKKMKKVVYYETDSSSSSTSSAESTTSKRHERKKYSKMPLRYPRISKRAPLLSVPLGKPPNFDGEDYCMWSDKMRHHLTSLHESIWDIVEFGAQAPQVGDEDYDSDEATQIRLLGRRRRPHPSLEVFAVVVGPTETRQRVGTPLARYDIGRRPVTRSSHRAASSSMEAHV